MTDYDILKEGVLEDRLTEAAVRLCPASVSDFHSKFMMVANGDTEKARTKAEGQTSGDGAIRFKLSDDGKSVMVKNEVTGDFQPIFIQDAKPDRPSVMFQDVRKEEEKRKREEKQAGILAVWESAPALTESDLKGNYLTEKKGLPWASLSGLGLKCLICSHARTTYREAAVAIRDCGSGRVVGYERYLPIGGKFTKLAPKGWNQPVSPCWVPIGFTTPDTSRRIVLCEGLATATAASILFPSEQIASCRSISDVVRVAEWASRTFPGVVVMTEGRSVASSVETELRRLHGKCPSVQFRLPAMKQVKPDEIDAIRKGWDVWDLWDSLGRPGKGTLSVDDLPPGLVIPEEEAQTEGRLARAEEVLARWAVTDTKGNFKGFRGSVQCVQAILNDPVLFHEWGRDTSPAGFVIRMNGEWQKTGPESLKAYLLETCDEIGVLRTHLGESITAAIRTEMEKRTHSRPIYDLPTDILRKVGLDVEWDGVDRWNEAAERMGLDVSTPERRAYSCQWSACLFSCLYARAHLVDPFGTDCHGLREELDVLGRAHVRPRFPIYSVKEDVVFIIHGRQGLRKSTLCGAICGGLRCDFAFLRDETEMLRKIYSSGGVFGFVREWGELRGYGDSQTNTSKEFVSRSFDELRDLYENPVSHARRFVFVGTTNDNDFLRDPTGSRRFAVVDAPRPANIGWIETNAPQLWAQAKHHVMGVLGGGERGLDDLGTLPDGRRPDTFKTWGEIQAMMKTIPNEGIGRMNDILLAMGNVMGIAGDYSDEDPIGDRLELALAKRTRRAMDGDEATPRPADRPSRVEEECRKATQEGYTLLELMDMTDLEASRPQHKKAMSDSLMRAGWEKRKIGTKRRWVVHPERAEDFWNRVEAIAYGLPSPEDAPFQSPY